MRIAALFALVCSAAVAQGLQPGTKLLAPVTYKQLTVLPVVRTAHVAAADYLSLAEGLQRRSVVVREMPGGGAVNTLRVRNDSQRALLLLGGELLLGGQQDRIVGQETVVPPRSEQLVSVFCVEHGRWSGSGQFGAVGGFAEPSVRGKAKYDANQAGVWQQVAEKTAALKAESSTGTYRRAAAAKQTAAFREAILGGLSKAPHDQLVGFAAAVNGRITSVEIFATPEMFAKYRDGLVDSLAVAAASEAEQAEAPPVRAEDVDRFVESARKAPKAAERVEGGAHLRKMQAPGVAASAVEAKDSAVPVYESIQSH